MLKRYTGYKRLLALAALSGGAAPVEDIATGNPLTFITDVSKPLKSLVANFLPVQASGTPSPDNVLPITGWTGVNVYHGDTYGFIQGGISDSTGVETLSQQRIKTDYIPYSGNPTFFVDGKGFGSDGRLRTIHWYDSSKTWISGSFLDEKPMPYTNNKTVPQNTAYMRIVAQWNDDTKNISPTGKYIGIDNTKYPVTWQTHGTIYGGYVDLVSGVLTVEWTTKALDGSEDWKINTAASNLYYVIVNDCKANSTNVVCDSYMKTNASGASMVAGEVKKANLNFNFKTTYDTLEAWETALAENNVVICYELATPVEIQLTPQQINAIKNQTNTIWSDGNGDCAVTFLKKG